MGWIRTTRIFLISTLASALILLAVLFSLMRALLPHATGYIHEIEQAISEQAGLPVSIRSLDADMYWFTPRLKLLDLVIYREDGEQLIAFSEANFSLDFFESLRRMSLSAGMIHLHGAELTVDRYTDTQWAVQGYAVDLEGADADPDDIRALVLNTDLALIDSTVHWRDHSGNSPNMDFEGATVMIENAFDTHALEVDLKLPDYLGRSLRIVLELSGDLDEPGSLVGDFYLRGERMLLHNWVAVSRMKKYFNGSGMFDAEVWATFSSAHLTHLSGSLRGEGIRLFNRDRPDISWPAGDMAMRFFLRDINEGWRLDIRELVLDSGTRGWREPADVIVSNFEGDWRLQANYFRPDELVRLLGVLPDGAVDLPDLNIGQYELSGEFFNVEVLFTEGDAPDYEFSGAFTDFSFRLPDRQLDFKGLDGHLDYRQGRAKLELATRNAVLSAGAMFREPLPLDRLSGTVSLAHENGDLTLSSDAVYAANADIETVTRLEIDVPRAGPVFIDMQARYANAVATSAWRYAPVSLMSKTLVSWIDHAFKGGIVREGGFIFRGYGAEFPFRGNQGLMQALFDVEDAKLQFMEHWPVANNLSATVMFHNSALRVMNARGSEANGVFVRATADIDDLEHALLQVQADIEASAEDVQQYVWNSPLDKPLGTGMKQFQASGPVSIRLGLQVPLSVNERKLRVEGTARFDNNELFFEQMNYTLERVSGEVVFDGNAIQQGKLTARFGGDPVAIDVRTSPDPRSSETIFNIQGRWKADALLRAAPFDATRFANGRADFSVKVKVPLQHQEYDVLVDVTSTLEGISINFSEAISKAKQERVPIWLKYRFFRGAQGIQLVSTDRIDLAASLDDAGYWNAVVETGVLKGKIRIEQHFDTNSTADLDLDLLNLNAFIPKAQGAGSTITLKASDLPSIQLTARELLWKQASLRNVRLVADHHARGLVFSELSVKDPVLSVEGRGSWMRHSWHAGEETSISLKISSPQAGDMLERAGFSRYVNRCSFDATVDWRWPGEPQGFSWEALTGRSSVKLQNGVITDIDPGAGRLLGLFNILHLPKRLGLNFEELYRKGFVFDSIAGDYVLSGGDAVTQNTEIKASTADMTMMGRIGISAEDYDMVTMVMPHTTAATFAGGTLIAGPTIGLGLALLQEMLGIELLGRDVYTVKGSWHHPEIRKIAAGGDTPVDEFEE